MNLIKRKRKAKSPDFEFDEIDLAANQDGVLSDRQRKNLTTERNVVRFAAVAFSIMLGLPCLALFVWFEFRNGFDFAHFIFTARQSLIIWLPLLVIYGWGMYRLISLNRDLRHPPAFVEGEVTIKPRPYYEIRIEDKRFRVSWKMMRFFLDFTPYRIYYAPYTKTVLSAERLAWRKTK